MQTTFTMQQAIEFARGYHDGRAYGEPKDKPEDASMAAVYMQGYEIGVRDYCMIELGEE